MNYQKWLNRFQEAHGHRPWALITGGSSGMGLEYARQLAEIGCNLLLVSNQKEELEKVSEDLKRNSTLQVVPHYQDLATESAAEELFGFCQAVGLQIDFLINNAGMFFFEELTTENESKALTMMRLHVYTPTKLCVLFGEEMKKRGYGYLINMSSMAAKLPCPGITVYSATKAYLKSFGKSLYFEMRRGCDDGLSRRHCHTALQTETQFVESWSENRADWHAAMVGAQGLEWNDTEKKSGETGLYELLPATADCLVAS